jgi:hypothetical protein
MSSIKVVVRLRPLSLDPARGEKWAPGFDIHGRRIAFGGTHFDPDVLLTAESRQCDVYDHAVPILESVVNGCNGTMLVYGQTGTGKTHTMIGSGDEYDGIAIRSIAYLLNHVRTQTEMGKQLSLSLSVLEIYNERITDMLAEGDHEISLINGVPRNASGVTLCDLGEATATVKKALNARHVSQTAMNDRSSRSHVIFMLDLAEVTETATVTSRLFLADLAGSESIRKSQVSGKAAQEAGMINKSLLALKTVILKLSASSGDSAPTPAVRGHVPYRDSRLTELLQDSIGGTARTMFIACISGNGRDIDETKSTLEYATKAHSIRNVGNTDREKMQIKIRGLELELLKAKNRLDRVAAEKGGYYVSKEEVEAMAADRERLGQLEEDVKTLMQDNQAARAATNVSKSQIGLYQAFLREKDQETQAAKAALARAMQQLHNSAATIETTLTKNTQMCRQAAEDDFAATTQQLADAVRMLESDTVTEETAKIVDAMWARVNKRHQDAVSRLVAAYGDLAQSALDVQSRQTRQVSDAVARMVSTLQHQADALQSFVLSAGTDLRQDVEVGRSNVDAAAKLVLDLSDPHAVQSLVSNVRCAARDVVRTIPAPGLSENTSRAFHSSQMGLRTAVASLSRTAIPALSNFNAPADLLRPQVSTSLPSIASADPDTPAEAGTPTETASQRPRRTALAMRSTANEVAQGKRVRSFSTDAGLEAARRRPTH